MQLPPQTPPPRPLENLREEKVSVEMLSDGREEDPPPPPPPPPPPGGSDAPHDAPAMPQPPAQPPVTKDAHPGEEGAPFELRFIDDEASSVEASLVSPAPLTRPEDEFFFEDDEDDDSVGVRAGATGAEGSAEGSSADALSPGSTVLSTETTKEFIIHTPD